MRRTQGYFAPMSFSQGSGAMSFSQGLILPMRRTQTSRGQGSFVFEGTFISFSKFELHIPNPAFSLKFGPEGLAEMLRHARWANYVGMGVCERRCVCERRTSCMDRRTLLDDAAVCRAGSMCSDRTAPVLGADCR